MKQAFDAVEQALKDAPYRGDNEPKPSIYFGATPKSRVRPSGYVVLRLGALARGDLLVGEDYGRYDVTIDIVFSAAERQQFLAMAEWVMLAALDFRGVGSGAEGLPTENTYSATISVTVSVDVG